MAAALSVLLRFNAQPAALKSPFAARELRQLTQFLLALCSGQWSSSRGRERGKEVHVDKVELESSDNAHTYGGQIRGKREEAKLVQCASFRYRFLAKENATQQKSRLRATEHTMEYQLRASELLHACI